jgi:hypothetical protein
MLRKERNLMEISGIQQRLILQLCPPRCHSFTKVKRKVLFRPLLCAFLQSIKMACDPSRVPTCDWTERDP